jgi:hypothetical protein
MSEQTWAQELNTGLGALAEDLERARQAAGSPGGGDVPVGTGAVTDWLALMERVKQMGAIVVSAAAKYDGHMRDASGKLAKASQTIQGLQGHVQQLQSQLKPAGVGGANPTGLGSGQTVYISAGATAGIAAGALLIGGFGGYAAKAYLDTRKKKAAAAEAARETEEEETEEIDETPKPKRVTKKK